MENHGELPAGFDDGFWALVGVCFFGSLVFWLGVWNFQEYLKTFSTETIQVNAVVAGKGDIQRFNLEQGATTGTAVAAGTALAGGSKKVVAINGIASTLATGFFSAEGCRMPLTVEGELRLLKAPEEVCKSGRFPAGTTVVIKKVTEYRTLGDPHTKTVNKVWYEW